MPTPIGILVARAPQLLCALVMSFLASGRTALQVLVATGLLIAGRAATLTIEPEGQWILVTPPEFGEALKPLIQHRQSQDFKVFVLQTTDVLTQEQIDQGDGSSLQKRL